MNGVGGAMTETMRLFFGTDDVSFSMSQGAVTRHYSSLLAAADEVVEVRILHGVHFRSADEDGRTPGRAHSPLGVPQDPRERHGHDEGRPGRVDRRGSEEND
jgi:hypothetical protein